MLAANASGASTLSFSQLVVVLSITAGAFVLGGLIVLLGRWALKSSSDTEQSFVRSWLAVILVIALVLFGVVSFFLTDTNLRSVLIGGLVASAGTAVAFYFSSKSADQARQDILNATFGTETVPDLKGRTTDQATRQLGKTSLQLVVDPASSTDQGAKVDIQRPPKDSVVRKGSQLVVTMKNGAGPAGDQEQDGPIADDHGQPPSPADSTGTNGS